MSLGRVASSGQGLGFWAGVVCTCHLWVLADVDPLTHAALGDASEVEIDELLTQKEAEEPGPDNGTSQENPPLCSSSSSPTSSSPSAVTQGACSVRGATAWDVGLICIKVQIKLLICSFLHKLLSSST